MEGRSNARQPARQPFDKILTAIGVAGGEVGNKPPCGLVPEARITRQRHGVDLDMVGDDELHARETNAVRGQAPPSKSGSRIGKIEHDLRPRGGQIRTVDRLCFKRCASGIDEALVALRARDGHILFVV